MPNGENEKQENLSEQDLSEGELFDQEPLDVSPAQPATIPGAQHWRAKVNGTELHYVETGEAGSPVLMVHGFPETWWAFHKVIPLLAKEHRVIAVDLRGFGDSSNEEGPFDRITTAEDLKQLIDHLGLGPMHVTGQDLGGPTVYTLAATAPDRLLSMTFIEAGLNGFGLEQYMDPTRGGSWHFGFFAAPYSEMSLRGHEREFLSSFAYDDFFDVKDAISPADIDEFLRTYSRPGGFRGSNGLYRSQVSDGDDLTALGRTRLKMPVFAVGGGGKTGFGEHTRETAEKIADDMRAVMIPDAGHFVAQERPEELAANLLQFFREVDGKSADEESKGRIFLRRIKSMNRRGFGKVSAAAL